MVGAMAWASIINSANAYVLDITREDERARGMSYITAGLSVGGTIGPFFTSLLMYVFQENFRLTFFILLIFCFPSFIVVLLLKEDQKNHVYAIFNKKSNYIKLN